MRRGAFRTVGKTGLGRPGRWQAGRSRLFGWVAVLAILIQTLLPDFAMAARVSAPDRAGAVFDGLCLANPAPPGASSDRPAPALAGQGGTCVFCLALSAHGLAPASGVEPVPLLYGETVAVMPGAGLPPWSKERTGPSPRAPPGA